MGYSTEDLVDRSVPFVHEIRDRTTGPELEAWLNRERGPGSSTYDDLAAMITDGVRAGWAANVEVDGAHYRRSRIVDPVERLAWFSVTAVYMESHDVLRGQYHLHPYGEINLVVPLEPGAQLRGPNGWCGAGWTAPAPGSHHYPESRGGPVIALFYLPAGRISYDIAAPGART